jgi:hypothetical protein
MPFLIYIHLKYVIWLGIKTIVLILRNVFSKRFENTKRLIRSRKSKDRQTNGYKIKGKWTKMIYKTKD